MKHRMWGFFFILLAFALLAGISASAAPQPLSTSFTNGKLVPPSGDGQGLFKAVQTAVSAAPAAADPWILRQRVVTVDFEQLRGLEPPSNTNDPTPTAPAILYLNPFDDVLLPVKLLRIEQNGDRGYTWIGQVAVSELSQVVLTIRGRLLTGSITVPHGQFEVRPSGGTIRMGI